ncbi:MAG TPA: hypothetical protein VKT72_11080 [Candidatus Baltobacteraceae bacterium]|nr:hypothetical protein [Candidatus Baltobacteraceae bacterium]
MNRSIRFAALAAAVVLQTSCGGSNAVNPAHPVYPAVQPLHALVNGAPPHASGAQAIYSITYYNDDLEYWPLSPDGGKRPTILSAKASHEGMAADGNDLLVGAANSSALEIFDTATQTAKTFSNPFGPPGDVAVDRQHNIYVFDFATPPGNVAEFPAADRNHPFELTCNQIYIGGQLAVDDEGDVFAVTTGPPPGYPSLVLEFAKTVTGHSACANLDLIDPANSPSGLALDPQTDDLLIMDNPDQCAGGFEGRVRIYSKPYQKGNYRILNMGANCAGGLRLSADSKQIFAGDEDVSGSFFYIIQRGYPGGRKLGNFWNGAATGFATIPNTLPN